MAVSLLNIAWNHQFLICRHVKQLSNPRAFQSSTGSTSPEYHGSILSCMCISITVHMCMFILIYHIYNILYIYHVMHVYYNSSGYWLLVVKHLLINICIGTIHVNICSVINTHSFPASSGLRRSTSLCGVLNEFI